METAKLILDQVRIAIYIVISVCMTGVSIRAFTRAEYREGTWLIGVASGVVAWYAGMLAIWRMFGS